MLGLGIRTTKKQNCPSLIFLNSASDDEERILSLYSTVRRTMTQQQQRRKELMESRRYGSRDSSSKKETATPLRLQPPRSTRTGVVSVSFSMLFLGAAVAMAMATTMMMMTTMPMMESVLRFQVVDGFQTQQHRYHQNMFGLKTGSVSSVMPPLSSLSMNDASEEDNIKEEGSSTSTTSAVNEDVATSSKDVVLEIEEKNNDEEEGELMVEKTSLMNNNNNNSNDNPYAFNNGYLVSSCYSAYLDKNKTPKWLRKIFGNTQRSDANVNTDDMMDMNEDGYADMLRRNTYRSRLYKAVRYPVRLFKRTNKRTKQMGTLILVRHGESEWNKDKIFTGWADPDLTEQGLREVEHAARLLMEGGYNIDVVFTSRLKRSIRSSWVLLGELSQVHLPVFKSWRLNERNYGALTGLSKTQTAERLGQELVQEWRGSLRSRPPPLEVDSTYYPGNDRKYADLKRDQIPLTESLLDCMERTAPLWEKKIKYELQRGRNVMVVAHANTLRGLVKTIDDIGDNEIQEIAIPTGIPIVYKFDEELKPIPPSKEEHSVSQVHMSGKFLEKPGLLKEAMKREAEWSKNVPGYDSTMNRHKRPMTGLERSLYKLNAERELGAWASEFIDWEKVEDDGNDGNFGRPIALTEDEVWDQGMKELEEGDQFDPDYTFFHDADESVPNSTSKTVSLPSVTTSTVSEYHDVEDEKKFDQDDRAEANLFAKPCVTPISDMQSDGAGPSRQDSVIVIIRHGKTQHNKLGLFTGWEDAPLADEGVEEAKEAGRLLKRHGFEFDVVYTSWLSRALETALYVIDEMDLLWLPIIKTWRLNERMYGELTGLSKLMVKQRHGEKQFKAWRRGYDVRPPPVSSFSQHYPGNDIRYQKYLRDVRYSFRESIIRSIEKGRPTLARKLPKSESLKDCMDRTVPYFVERIANDAVDQNKRVLISSSENAIRGLLMHLCDIPESEITGLEIPNGLPIIYDVRSKCVKLLDDGTGRDPLEVYNFGSAAQYLFRPCENEDGTLDEECSINFGDGNLFISEQDQQTIDFIKQKIGSPNSTAISA